MSAMDYSDVIANQPVVIDNVRAGNLHLILCFILLFIFGSLNRGVILLLDSYRCRVQES